MANALIGHTGFVGTNLLLAHEFSARFNSQNISDIEGKRYELVVCAAAPASMWAANKDPDGDLANIRRLLSHLEKVTAERFVLISTIATLAEPTGLDEDANRFEANKAYGSNRRFLEEAAAALFPKIHILRLPALYGVGLKKNFIFDIANPIPSFLTEAKFAELSDRLPGPAAAVLRAVYHHDAALGMLRCDRKALVGTGQIALTDALFDAGFSAVHFTHADSTFQYYGLDRLWRDIEVVVANELPIVHLAPEPLRARDIHQTLTGRPFDGRTAPLYHEDMRTRHATLWDAKDPYLVNSAGVLHDLKIFFEKGAMS
ncbi:hypothetical protein QA645_17560 [Bradyrhizobium sp. CIAT3101]|uniref:hypothetical protein n=1 Tax=Bradyrhizobium sp. CIAT3101 TaxID=439387 RepID=UPI0024B0ACB3|nr:hypothetical protein [Bradyrhizobium sp. CIAT3101]WFU84470.1 hypothetical protein QA645_17560 [Bradyrhizobium sp. CIAT3101]